MAILQPPPFNVKIINPDGTIPDVWERYLLNLTGLLDTVSVLVNTIPGVNVFTQATQPTLGTGDAGYLGFLTDYNHFVRWTGTAWTFAPGDVGNKFFRDFVGAPQETGWQLCDGTATTYLTMGATLTVTSFTTPNLSGLPAYKKSAAAYSGTVNAASGVTGTSTTGTGTTGTGTTGTGTTGNESAHTHPEAGTFFVQAGGVGALVGGTTTSIDVDLTGGTTGAGSAHSHSVPGLSVPGLSVPGLSIPGLGPGTLDLANLAVLPYFRR